jgi:PadR family transcriptional regulator PadR
MTITTQAVLGVLLAAEDESFGLEIVRASGLGAGTVYPILARLLAAGWVDARWEEHEHAHDAGRPPRRYYHLTAQGQARTVHVLHAGGQQRRSLARLLGAEPTPQPRLAEGT